ncbi:MAG: hypothetical protein KAH25_00960, partial [Bacteroidales bacterium]|nr:hypothetical protein [Bacteroidales bacterium]
KKKDSRRIYVKIWYPAMNTQGMIPDLYLQNYSAELIHGIFQSKDFSEEWLAEIKKQRTNSYPNADLDTSKEQFPMIVFTPGYYFGMAELYSAYMEELASHGYIVCSVNHPYEQPYISFPDEDIYIKKKRTQWAYLQLVFANWFHFRNTESKEKIEKTTRYYHKMLHRFNKALDYWVDDTKFFLDYLETHARAHTNNVVKAIDMDRIGGLGQSFGGAVIGQLCLRDERVKAGINLDCFQFGDVIDEPLKQPLLLIQSDYQPTWNMGNTINYEHNKGDFLLLHLNKASHFVFSDGAVLPYNTKDFENRMIGEVDGSFLLEITNNYMLDFFNHYLNDTKADLIFQDVENTDYKFNFRKGDSTH